MTSRKSTGKISNLPNEVLFNIASRLCLEDSLNFKNTCQRLQRLSAYDCYWKSPKEVIKLSEENPLFGETIIKIGRKKKLSLIAFKPFWQHFKTANQYPFDLILVNIKSPSIAIALFNPCETLNIAKLCIFNGGEKVQENLIQSLTPVTADCNSFQLSNVSFNEHFGSIFPLIQRLPKLTSLCITAIQFDSEWYHSNSYIDVQILITVFTSSLRTSIFGKNLCELTLDLRFFSESQIREILSAAATIKHLSLSGQSIGLQTLTGLSAQSRIDLQSLNINFVPHQETNTLLELLRLLPFCAEYNFGKETWLAELLEFYVFQLQLSHFDGVLQLCGGFVDEPLFTRTLRAVRLFCQANQYRYSAIFTELSDREKILKLKIRFNNTKKVVFILNSWT